ncbi:hypothetical protein EJ06DRAFT_569124 [Trichodelitschia bisporula]|uniref:Lactase n=1 Tax=Trichodelitschia bisporula TaxID=703511 RepID=A0A6G1I9W4_9PEZI|nr:hypothetical protein EJ06DRAFT_569124 [Trichodelitschia bisporula]
MSARSEPPDYENEAIVKRNRLPPRAYWIPPDALLLDGVWDFHYAKCVIEAPDPPSPDVAPNTTSGDSSIPDSEPEPAPAWTSITVPGHWQLQGHGHPHYTNIDFPFPVAPPRVPSENTTGTYRRRFRVPSAWAADAQVRLRFDGVDSAFHVWVNGVLVGYSQGSRNAAEFDVSGAVRRRGEEEVWVRVYRWCDGSYLEDQDMWWLSGIFRDVHLIAFPREARIEDFFASTELDNGGSKVPVKATLKIALTLTLYHDVIITASLTHPSLSAPITTKVGLYTGVKSHHLTLPVRAPHLWTAETPHLYTLTLTLSAPLSQPLQTITHPIGLRTVSLHNNLISINNTPIHLRGVNHHDHNPDRGRAVSAADIRTDILLMKAHNINALRCSHYPPHPSLPTLASELGLYLIDEADLECHGFSSTGSTPESWTSNNPAWRPAYVDRMAQLVARDKNASSVIIWSLGNESFLGANHGHMAALARKMDPTRLIHYEPDKDLKYADIRSDMYLSPAALLAQAQGPGPPIILCEFAHAMGNAPGGLMAYIHAFRASPRLQGGFIWEWASHGLWVPGDPSKPGCEREGYYAYGGEFGDQPNDGDFVIDGLCTSAHAPGPGLAEVNKAYAPVRIKIDEESLRIHIINEHDFQDLSYLSGSWSLAVVAPPSAARQYDTGVLHFPPLVPGASATLPFALHTFTFPPHTWLTVSLATNKVTPWASAGHEVACAQALLPFVPAAHVPPALPAPNDITLSTSRSTFTVTTPISTLIFSRRFGALSAWTANGTELLAAPSSVPNVRVSLTRPATSNDTHGGDAAYFASYGIGAMQTRVQSFTAARCAAGIMLVAETDLAPPVRAWGVRCGVTYTVGLTGLGVGVKMEPSGREEKPAWVPRCGIEVRLRDRAGAGGEDMRVEYAGWGPGSAYADRWLGARMGVWRHTVRDMDGALEYEVPQEGGNRLAVKWVRVGGVEVRRMQGEDGGVRDEEWGFAFQVSRYNDADVDAAKHPRDLVPVPGVVRLRVDDVGSGVGTGACGPGVAEETRVWVNELREFRFWMEVG